MPNSFTPGSYVDMLNRKLVLKNRPQRIVSLVPSQTELLFDLGMRDEVVGITRFCVHPEHWFNSKPRVGGTKETLPDRIFDLQPDLVLANKEENQMSLIDSLEKSVPVWVSDVKSLQDSLNMIQGIGEITGFEENGTALVQETMNLMQTIQNISEPLRVLYLIWHEPWMSIGSDTYIHDLLNHLGYENALPESNKRYPVLTNESIQNLNPDLVFLSSEPFPFKQKHANLLKEVIPNALIYFVDGEAFSWYGSRVLKKQKYFHELAISTRIRR